MGVWVEEWGWWWCEERRKGGGVNWELMWKVGVWEIKGRRL